MNVDISSTQLVLALAAGVVGAGYIALILVPAWECYGRLWEKLAATFLSLYILVTLLGIGSAIGLAIVWSYDQYA
jgi:hypothetical protein